MNETTNPRWAFIVNPVAGNGKSLVVEKQLKIEIEKRNLIAETAPTERKNHASELAENFAKRDFNFIVAVGGDGTLNETAKALVNFPDIILGLIPAGTGNDFAQILALPKSFKNADWNTFFDAHICKVDVGRCNGNLFFNGMGLGFDAQVAVENYISPDEVKKGGANKYIGHILKNLFFFKEQNMIIDLEGKQMKETCFIHTISIGRRYAGGFFLTPKAFADDGLFDICMVKKLNLFQRVSILLKVPKGTHLSHPKVNYYQADKLKIKVDKKVAYHLDGELFFDTDFDIDILKHKLRFIYFPKGNHYLSSC